ncbi:MAG: hypothetical protein HY901_16865 [Deltaproteobacteria bacterium]|nr:hypothetical protein [Deltaproteobacteria bacterium]
MRFHSAFWMLALAAGLAPGCKPNEDAGASDADIGVLARDVDPGRADIGSVPAAPPT